MLGTSTRLPASAVPSPRRSPRVAGLRRTHSEVVIVRMIEMLAYPAGRRSRLGQIIRCVSLQQCPIIPAHRTLLQMIQALGSVAVAKNPNVPKVQSG